MIYLELSDEETEYSTEFPVEDIDDIFHTFEEMVRMYTNSDLEVDSYILERAKEINIKNSN